jgi:hypothetical protein
MGRCEIPNHPSASKHEGVTRIARGGAPVHHAVHFELPKRKGSHRSIAVGQTKRQSITRKSSADSEKRSQTVYTKSIH